MAPPLNVVIVEAHHHCLEHIHAILRKKKIFRPWALLHFDAHPDLACPTVPAVACFTPRQIVGELTSEEEAKDLYQLLDSTTSGIAEWIIPLVLAAQLQTIEWIKPKFSKQLQSGHHRFQVGVFEPSRGDDAKDKPIHFCDLSLQAQLKVDWNHPYYLDDNSVVALQYLALPQTVNLHVTESDQVNATGSSALEFTAFLRDSPHPWILDICLDYFACWNPYLSDIDSIDPDLTAAFLKVMTESTCFQDCSISSHNPPSNHETSYRQTLQNFRSLLRQLLTAAGTGDNGQKEATTTTTLCLKKLSSYYTSPEVCEALIRTLQDQIRSQGGKALSFILEAIPFWNMPHAPSSSLDMDQIDKSLGSVECMLQQLMHPSTTTSNPLSIPPPFLVTIARSTCDGFTPAQVVEEIQEKILGMLHRIFCPGHCDRTDDCVLCITRDYGEWEGSTIL